MADRYWDPKAIAVVNIATVTVTAFDATTTYSIKVNGFELVAELGDTDVTGTAAAIVASWNLLTHPYAAGITASNIAGALTFTGDTAGVPFTVTTAVATGTGTFGSVTVTQAATGPNQVDDADNWDGGTLPSNSDALYFRDSAIHAAWGLDGLTTTGHVLHVEQSFTGKIGLNRAGVATSADGQTVDTAAPEYRAAYLQLDCATILIGEHTGIGDPGGSQRIMIDNDRASASTCTVYRSAASGSESGKPPIRYLAAHASANIDILDGRIGVAVDTPGETSTIGNITARAGGFILGDGVTVTNITQSDGTSLATLGVATLTKALVHGGQLTINGDQAITTLEVTGGTVISNTTGTITTVTHKSGEVDYSRSSEARTITTHQLYPGATVRTDDDVITIGSLLEPDGPSVISVS